MKTVPFGFIFLLLFTSFAIGGEQKTVATELVEKARNECTSIDDGKFHSTEKTIILHDFTGDGRPEEVVDASQFSCSTSASLWGGSGGTYLWILVGKEKFEFLANKWRVVDVDGQKVLLLAVHSSECSDTVGPCYRALVWSNGFRTTR